jgi:hypothetical protein
MYFGGSVMREHSGDGAVAEFQAPDYLFFVRGGKVFDTSSKSHDHPSWR